MGDQLVNKLILLAVCNGCRHLPELLSSLQAQTDPYFSVLMQDDGSEDGSPALLQDIAARDPRFTFGVEQGRHLGAAGNFLSLLRQARADYVFFCDQDDIWEPAKVETLMREMDRMETEYGRETPLLVHSDCSLIDESGEEISGSFFAHQGWDPAAVTLPRLLVQNNVTGCTLVMNAPLAKLVAENAKAKELFMHDWFIALTAASFGRIAFIAQPLTRYRQHDGNAIGASKQPLPVRALAALANRSKAKRRILLTYTHTQVFRKLYEGKLPQGALNVVDRYLATRRMWKIPRVLAVRRMGCVMQSPLTRLGQILFG